MTLAATEVRSRTQDPAGPRVTGEAILYRLFDVGYEIRLDQAYDLLRSTAPERRKPVRGEAHAIQIPNPPITVHLGSESVSVGEGTQEVQVSGRVFDFGVVSLRARIELPTTSWSEFVALGVAAGSSAAWAVFDGCRVRLLDRMRSAIVRPEVAKVSEEYIVYRIGRIEDGAGRPLRPDCLSEDEIARLLTGEPRPLSARARSELLSHRYSYLEDDLAIVAWSSALVVESVPEDTDVQYVLEFANAQLLELRVYDALLDGEVPRIYDEIAAARRRRLFGSSRFSRLLADIQTRVADATEAVERAENSLKVTDDVYLARIYGGAMEIFREAAWRSGIDRKVAIVRDTYTMLNAETQVRRAEVLELVVIVLIVLEIALAIWRP